MAFLSNFQLRRFNQECYYNPIRFCSWFAKVRDGPLLMLGDVVPAKVSWLDILLPPHAPNRHWARADMTPCHHSLDLSGPDARGCVVTITILHHIENHRLA